MNRQGWVIRGLLLLGMLACWAQAGAQGVPPELQSSYSGTMKVTTYAPGGVPEKSTMTTIITLHQSTWEVQTIGEISTTYVGSVAMLGPYLFGSAYYNTMGLGGRLQLKGKPGKEKLSGKLMAGDGLYWGTADLTVKAKRDLPGT